MGRLLIRWLILTLSVIVVAKVEKEMGLGLRTELDFGGSFVTVLIGVALFALVNATLGKVLKFLTIPLNCLTLGLFSLVINAAILMLVASFGVGLLIEGEGFQRFLSAFIGAILISIINGILNMILPDKDKDG